MIWIDTHTHLYSDSFEEDIHLVIQKAIKEGVIKMMLPNINWESYPLMMKLVQEYPDSLYPMIGLHPCDVKENWEEVLAKLEQAMSNHAFIGIGETGIDLYWDRSTLDIQTCAFIEQIHWAKRTRKPIIIHARESMNPILDIIEKNWDSDLTGIFHCFSGDEIQLQRIQDLRTFKIGIGGTITYKNNPIRNLLQPEHLSMMVLETDSPYLPPVPHRGKRNESSYIPLIGEALSNLLAIPVQTIAERTTQNALAIFQFNS